MFIKTSACMIDMVFASEGHLTCFVNKSLCNNTIIYHTLRNESTRCFSKVYWSIFKFTWFVKILYALF